MGNIFDQFDSAQQAAPPAGAPGAAAPQPRGNVFDQFDTPSPSETTTAGRLAGLGGRALLRGAGDLTDLPQNLIAGTDQLGKVIADHIRALIGLHPSSGTVQGTTRGRDAATAAAAALGLPTPATGAERIGSAAVEALPSAVLAGPEALAALPGIAASGAASQAVAEAGGGKTLQLLAGLAAPLTGAGLAATVRGAVRGTSGAAMQATAADAAASGVPLSVGQAAGNRAVQELEAVSRAYWGGGPFSRLSQQQAEAVSDRVDQIVGNLSRGGDVSPTGAGQAINAGAAGARVAMRQAEDAAYGQVEQLIPQGTKINVRNASQLLDDLTTPVYGAEKTTGSLVSPTLAKIQTNLAEDLAAGGNTLPYAAVRQLRTRVGNMVDWGFSPADPVTNSGLKKFYGALSQDLNDGAAAISPQAETAAKQANALYKANSDRRDFLDSVINKAGGPETVYNAALAGTRDGATRLARVMSSLPQDEQDLVRATVLSRMGRAVASQQNAVGDALSPDTFLTNWARMSPEAKAVLFGTSQNGSQLRSALDSLTQTLAAVRGSKPLFNPSGTGSMVIHAGSLFEAVRGLLTGNFHLAGAIAGSVVANNVMARALTNPRTVQWLATATKLPPSLTPVALGQLSRLAQSDTDAANLASILRAAGKASAGSGASPPPLP